MSLPIKKGDIFPWFSDFRMAIQPGLEDPGALGAASLALSGSVFRALRRWSVARRVRKAKIVQNFGLQEAESGAVCLLHF